MEQATASGATRGPRLVQAIPGVGCGSSALGRSRDPGVAKIGSNLNCLPKEVSNWEAIAAAHTAERWGEVLIASDDGLEIRIPGEFGVAIKGGLTLRSVRRNPKLLDGHALGWEYSAPGAVGSLGFSAWSKLMSRRLIRRRSP
jgi:hypothetical protein